MEKDENKNNRNGERQACRENGYGRTSEHERIKPKKKKGIGHTMIRIMK